MANTLNQFILRQTSDLNSKITEGNKKTGERRNIETNEEKQGFRIWDKPIWTYGIDIFVISLHVSHIFSYYYLTNAKKGVPSAESSHSVRGLGKGVSGKPYPRLCNARRPRLEPGTFRSQAVRLYRLHQARPSLSNQRYSDIFTIS